MNNRLGLTAALLGALTASACDGRPRHADETDEGAPAPASTAGAGAAVMVELDLSRGVPEEVAAPLFGAAPRRAHVDLVRVLRALADAPPKGVFVRLGGGVIGLAGAQEIGADLGKLRARGVPVVCHADELDNASLLLTASGCSKVWMSPAGGVEAIGLAAHLIYARSLLDRLHVSVDFLQIGKYKGAEEPFTRDGPSPEARASLVGALSGMRTSWLTGLTAGRDKPGLAEIAEDGPFTPEDARARGLLDAVGYDDEALDDARKLAGVERTVARFGGEAAAPLPFGISGALRALEGTGSGSPRVAVVPAIGAISMGGSPSLPFGGGGGGISARELGRELARLTRDDAVKAVVIRIDSPGGSALASDLLWRKLMKLREKKKLVFSVGGMAASGGYYMAATATKIVAEPTSLLGSIGVVGGKIAVGNALAEIGVHAETISASPDPKTAARSSYLSVFTPWDDRTRERVRASMQAVYDLFLRRVAEGRGTTVEKIAPSAEGQVFGGVEAKQRGLVDELGGFGEALDLAKELAGLPADTPFEVVGDSPGLFGLLDGGSSNQESRAEGVAASAGRAAQQALVPAWAARAPEVSAFLGSMAPLLEGERALSALPFGLVIR